MPQETKSKAEVGHQDSPSLQGLVASGENEAELLDALEKAFDYRGDITVTLDDGSVVSGYIFDRVRGERLGDSFVRLLGAKSDEKVVIGFDRIARLEFSGKDTAAGKSFETWIRKYAEKKLAGQEASIYADGQDAEGAT